MLFNALLLADILSYKKVEGVRRTLPDLLGRHDSLFVWLLLSAVLAIFLICDTFSRNPLFLIVLIIYSSHVWTTFKVLIKPEDKLKEGWQEPVRKDLFRTATRAILLYLIVLK